MTDFLQHSVDKTQSARKKSKRTLKKRTKKSLKTLGVVVVAFFVLVAAIAAINYPQAIKAYDQTIAGKESFEKAQTAIELQDFSGAEEHLRAANTQFTEARSSLGKLWVMHFVPFAGRQYSGAKHLLDAGIYASSGSADLIHIAVGIGDRIGGGEDFSFSNLTPESKAIILDEIHKSPPVLESAISDFEASTESIQDIPDFGMIAQIEEAKNLFAEVIPPATETLKEFAPMAETLPEIAGHPESKNYLLLFLNNTELRPGGGFIGTYGELTLASGEIEQLVTEDTYNLDKEAIDFLSVDPPWPMQRFLGSTQWFLRDANWSPDFRESSLQAVDFYQKENGPMQPIDGIIGFTPDFTASLLELTGPIASHGITFTSENFVEELEYQVEIRFQQQGIPMEERKEIIGDLSTALIDKIFQLPIAEWATLLEIFEENVAEKQIMFYFADADLQEFASSQEWTGGFKTTEGDYVRMIDANLGSLKSDPGVERTITHTVRYDEERDAPVATTDIYYVNNNDFTVFTTRYHTYTRLYVPGGIDLYAYEWNEDIVETKDEFDRTAISTYKTIEPREDEHLTFSYVLPDRIWEQIQDGTYTLDVQKQLGAHTHTVILDLDVGKNIKSYTEGENAIQDSKTHVRITDSLDTDKQFVVEF